MQLPPPSKRRGSGGSGSFLSPSCRHRAGAEPAGIGPAGVEPVNGSCKPAHPGGPGNPQVLTGPPRPGRIWGPTDRQRVGGREASFASARPPPQTRGCHPNRPHFSEARRYPWAPPRSAGYLRASGDVRFSTSLPAPVATMRRWWIARIFRFSPGLLAAGRDPGRVDRARRWGWGPVPRVPSLLARPRSGMKPAGGGGSGLREAAAAGCPVSELSVADFFHPAIVPGRGGANLPGPQDVILVQTAAAG